MSERRFRPRLNKKFVASRDGYDIYSVNGFAIRNLAQPDEEFTNFATRDEFPDLIPEGEIWISEKTLDREGEFFIANAVARLGALAEGASEESAYTTGLNVERKLRRQATRIEYRAGRPHQRIPGDVYVQHYHTLADEKFPVEVWLVSGCRVRSTYKTDYTEGGHGYVYRWVPKDEIWVEDTIDRAELPFIVTHEYTELRLMRDEKMEYDKAHEICSEVEFDLRKPESRKAFPGFSRHRVTKADLRRVTRPEFFDYVRKHYVHGIVRRVGALLADLPSKVLP